MTIFFTPSDIAIFYIVVIVSHSIRDKHTMCQYQFRIFLERVIKA